MANHIPVVASIFARVLGRREVSMDVRQTILQFCKQLMGQVGQQMQPVLAKWDAAMRDDFVKYVSGKEQLPPEIDPSEQKTHHAPKPGAAGDERKASSAASNLSLSTLSSAKPHAGRAENSGPQGGGGGPMNGPGPGPMNGGPPGGGGRG
jgi:hypothetical protein